MVSDGHDPDGLEGEAVIDLEQARARAEELVAIFRSADCTKVEIAGSIRRQKPEVKDIEIVAQPYLRTDLFGAPLDEDSKLDHLVAQMIRDGRLRKRLNGAGNAQAYGQKYKALATHDGMPLDLFIVRPPAQWGAVFAIRTGPADFSKYLVTACQGMALKCVEGRLVYADGGTFATPTEESFFKGCGVPWVPPEQRK